MPTPTYTPLANLTLSSGTATDVNFQNISQAYRDLRLVMSVQIPSGMNYFNLRINSITSGYERNYMWGDGSGTGSVYTGGQNGLHLTARNVNLPNDASVFAFFTVDLMDYSATDKHKIVLSRSSIQTTNNPEVGSQIGRLGITNAVTQVVIGTDSGSAPFAAGSTFALYGIAS